MPDSVYYTKSTAAILISAASPADETAPVSQGPASQTDAIALVSQGRA